MSKNRVDIGKLRYISVKYEQINVTEYSQVSGLYPESKMYVSSSSSSPEQMR